MRAPRAAVIRLGAVFAISMLLAFGIASILRPDASGPTSRPSVTVQVIGHLWSWEFVVHRPSTDAVYTVGVFTLHLGDLVEFRVTSADVVHSFWLADYALKIDAVPGREIVAFLELNRAGEFLWRNAEFSGAGHDGMVATMRVVPA